MGIRTHEVRPNDCSVDVPGRPTGRDSELRTVCPTLPGNLQEVILLMLQRERMRVSPFLSRTHHLSPLATRRDSSVCTPSRRSRLRVPAPTWSTRQDEKKSRKSSKSEKKLGGSLETGWGTTKRSSQTHDTTGVYARVRLGRQNLLVR